MSRKGANLMRKNARSHALILGIVMLSAFGTPANSQTLPGGASSLKETHEDWVVLCDLPQGNRRCLVRQEQIHKDTGQVVFAINLGPASDGPAATGALLLPFGLSIDQGITLSLEENAPLQQLRYSTCLPNGCLATLSFDQTTIGALQAGDALTVTAQAYEGSTSISLKVSLKGFTSAWNRSLELTNN